MCEEPFVHLRASFVPSADFGRGALPVFLNVMRARRPEVSWTRVEDEDERERTERSEQGA